MKPELRIAGTCSLLLLPAALLASPPTPAGTGASPNGTSSRAVPQALCADGLIDQSGGPCLQASSVPTPGLLFPPPHDGGVNNVASGQFSFVGGGYENLAVASNSTVSGGAVNSVFGYDATVGGGIVNEVGATGGTIAGGTVNLVTAQYGTVSGGRNNQATSGSATIGGGRSNTAEGYASVIAGGRYNDASSNTATVAGGFSNTACEYFSTAGGGRDNTASGSSATVPGGRDNLAQGDYGFAAGRRAKANHDGAFVWGDSFAGDKISSAPNQFNVYASGGTRIFSNTAATTGVLLAAGAGTWTSVSNRNAKENVEAVDGEEVLERLAEVPISTWNYRAQDATVRHMGPMAQDFYAAFGLGLGDKSIDTVDPDGVALAAIQALHRVQREKNEEIAALRSEVAELRRALETVLEK